MSGAKVVVTLDRVLRFLVVVPSFFGVTGFKPLYIRFLPLGFFDIRDASLVKIGEVVDVRA